MTVIDEQIEVDAPVRMTYDQWTQFEEFPEFMQGVREVDQLDGSNLRWVASIGGVRREWDARIVEQIPDQLVSWRSTSGARNDGHVSFDGLEDGRTRVSLHLELDPDGLVETLGDALGAVRLRAQGDLARFKSYVESNRRPTGAWRGEVADGEVVSSAQPGDQQVRGAGPVVEPQGEVAASTGGVVDLDRLVGSLTVAMVFVDPLDSRETRAALGALGEHLVEFGRDRVQVLAVAREDRADVERAAGSTAGNLRILADPDGRLAEGVGVEYRPGRPVVVTIGPDGRRRSVWEGPTGPELVPRLRLHLQGLDVA